MVYFWWRGGAGGRKLTKGGGTLNPKVYNSLYMGIYKRFMRKKFVYIKMLTLAIDKLRLEYFFQMSSFFVLWFSSEAVSRGVQGGDATPLSKSGGCEGPPCASHPPDFFPPLWLIIRGVQGTPLWYLKVLTAVFIQLTQITPLKNKVPKNPY